MLFCSSMTFKNNLTEQFHLFFYNLFILLLFLVMLGLVQVCGLSLLAVSGGYSLLQCVGFSLQ